MPNEIHANLTFYGPRIEEFRNSLKPLVKNYTIDIDDVCNLYNISEEARHERTYIEDIDLDDKDTVIINTWNAWNPKIGIWDEIYSHFLSEDGDEGLAYCLFAEDQDNPFKVVNTDYDGKYFENRYKVLYSNEEDGSIFEEYEYFSSLEDATSFVKDNNIQKYCIFMFCDEVEAFDEEPTFFDSNGCVVGPPEDNI